MSKKIGCYELSEDEFCGKKEIKGSLYLNGLTSIPDGFNPTVGGSLHLRGLTSIPDGFNPTVGGSLHLNGLTSIPDGFNPTVGGYLDLRGLTSIPDGFNPTVGGSLGLNGLTSIPDGFNPTVGGSLGLNGLTSIPDGFNPTVGGYLDLRGLTSIPDGFNPTVGGSLHLRGLTSIPDGFNPTVGGSLHLDGLTSIPDGGVKKNDISMGEIEKRLTWDGGKYRVIDGVFCEVITDRKSALKVRVEGEVKFVVTDGVNYAHGVSIKDARESLVYKIGNRDTSEYSDFKLNTTVSKEEAIKLYRVITGACEEGTRIFVEGLVNPPESLTVSDLIALTKGQYGNSQLESFFTK